MTKKTLKTAATAQRHFDALREIATKAEAWQLGSYKVATDELYVLLSDCYNSVATIRAQGTAVARELNKVLTKNNVVFNDGTRLETKVVRVVFGSIGKRAHIYARVLVNAREQNIAQADFITWLEAEGGVEAVRKQHKGLTPSEVKAQRVKVAETALATATSVQLKTAPKADDSDFVIALVHHTKGGK
jgi:hypothetical protein